MADWQQALICKVLYERDIKPALEAKVTPEFFSDDKHRKVWEFILHHYGEYSEVPTERTVLDEVPNYTLIKVEEPYQLVLDRLREKRRLHLAVQMATGVNGYLGQVDPDIDAALAEIASGLIRINTEVSILQDTDLTKTWEDRFEKYMALKDLDGALLGVPTGFPTMDEATAGLQPEQLVTFVGLPKAGKSTILLRVAKSVHDSGKVPLFIGFEMSNREQEMRYDAMLAGIDHHSLMRGTLTRAEERKLRTSMQEQADKQPFLLSSDIERGTTVSGILAKIEQYKPDALFIDGAYLMDDEQGEPRGEPRALTNITRGLKRAAQKQRIPIIVSTQALSWKTGKKGITQDSIGYTSSFAQDSDVIFGVEKTDEMDIIRLRIVEARNSGRKVVDLRADWQTATFEELGEVSEWDGEEDADRV